MAIKVAPRKGKVTKEEKDRRRRANDYWNKGIGTYSSITTPKEKVGGSRFGSREQKRADLKAAFGVRG